MDAPGSRTRAAVMNPCRYAISSGQAILNACRLSMASMKVAGSDQRFMSAGIESGVAAPHHLHFCNWPRDRYSLFRSVISNSPRADGFSCRAISKACSS